jgi:DNA polymerase-3 subunit delta'
MGFSEIIGHHKQVETLRQRLITGRLHHAYLFVGPEGVGKRTLAMALAQALHCARQAGDFCGQCPNCVAIQNNNHPDVRVIGPLMGKKEISIQQVREIEKELIYRSFSSGKKVAILDPATLMNWPAQNALLKTLEEPPQNCLLILIAARGGRLLPTVRSRCLRLSFASLSRHAVTGFLTSKAGKTAEEAEFLAALSQGSLATAKNIEQEGLLEGRRSWLTLLATLTAGNYRVGIEAAEALAGNREDALKFLQWAGSWYRDLLTQALTGDSHQVMNVDMTSQIDQQLTQADIPSLLSLFAKTVKAAERIHRNINRRMVIEEFLMAVVERG